MRWCWALLAVCTGCLQPNAKFEPDDDGSESATTVHPSETSIASTADGDAATSHGTSPTGTSAPQETGSTAPGEESGGSGGSETAQVSESTGAPSEHTIFVSSGDFAGDFAPIGAADQMCTDLAANAGLGGGTWTAILSDSTIDARDRIVVNGPIRNVMGELIAESETDLWDGFIATPVQYTETGEQFLASPFTGTNTDGTAAAANCNDWMTTGGATAVVGDAGFASEIWIDAGTAACGQSYPVYCISQ